MADSYGYKAPKLGYGYQTPTAPRPKQMLSPLATAAAKPLDPFFQTDTTNSAKVAAANPLPQQGASKTIVPATSSPGVAPQTPAVQQPGTGAVAGGVAYDLNTDPALQQAQSFLGMNDAQATAQALKQKQQALLAYGDPNLTSSLLGASDPFVEASKQNPTSTLAQLGQQHDRGLRDLGENYNKSNLTYSGARVLGEQQYGQDYQNALAQAAQGVNSQLGGIDSQLASALAQSNQGRIDALQNAYTAHLGDPGYDPTGAAGGGGALSGADGTTQDIVLPDQRNRSGITAAPGSAGQSGLTTDAILAALLGGPGASQSRLNRYAG